MRKLSIIALLASFLLFTSCENMLSSPKTTNFSFSLPKQEVSEFQRKVTRTTNITNDSLLHIQCSLLSDYVNIQEESDVALKDIDQLHFNFTDIEFGDYVVVVDVIHDNKVVFTGKSSPIELYANNDNIKVTLALKEKYYPLHLELNGGSFSSTEVIPPNYSIFANHKLPIPTKANCNFGGWYTQKNGGGVRVTSVGKEYFDGELTLYALFIDDNGVQPVEFKTPLNATNLDYNDQIELTCNTPGTKIYYTTDGSDPLNSKTKILYSSPISFTDEKITLQAYAEKQDKTVSIVSSAPRYTMKKYKVSFINKGTLVKTLNCHYLEKLTNEPLTNKGCKLEGWYTNELCTTGNKWNFDTMTVPKHDMSLYASWLVNSYTLKFDPNGGEGTFKDVTLSYEDTYTLPANPFTKSGYKFGGWYLSKDGSGTKYNEKDSVSKLTEEDNGIVTLYASWILDTYKVSFDANKPTKTESVMQGSMTDQIFNFNETKALTPCAYSLEGYLFKGWKASKDGVSVDYTDNKEVTNLPNAVNGVVTLYAHWEPITYTIRFLGNGNESGTMSDMTVAYDSEVPLTQNTFTKKGHTFTEWLYNDGIKESTCTDKQPIKNLTSVQGKRFDFTAQWSTHTYEVHFDSNIPTNTQSTLQGSMVNQSFNYGETKALSPSNYSLEGYVFLGWKTSKTGSKADFIDKTEVSNLTDINKEVINLYAHWRPITYTVIFDPTEPSITTNKTTQVFTYDEEKTLKTCTYEYKGHTFDKWFPDKTFDQMGVHYSNNEPVKNLSTTDGAEVTLYANWTVNTYNVRFNSNAPSTTSNVAQGTMQEQKFTYGLGQPLTSNAFILEGYTFKGWKTTPDGPAAKYKDGETVQNLTDACAVTVDLYAQWEPITYTVHFIGNGNDGGAMNDMTVLYDTKVPLTKNAFTLKGHTFNHWVMEDGIHVKDDEFPITNLASTQDAVVNLKADWTPNRYTVTFEPNCLDSTGGMTRMENLSYGVNQTLPPNGYERTGYMFNGWEYTAGGSKHTLSDGATFRDLTDVNGDTVKLKATWISTAVAITPVSGAIDLNTNITLSTPCNRTIYYTTDDGASENEYIDPIPFSDKNGMTIKAYTKDSSGVHGPESTESYTQKKYTLKIVLQPVMANVPDLHLAKGETYDLDSISALSPDGYQFVRWEDEKGQPVSGVITINNDTTITAVWEALKYNVKYDRNGGNGSLIPEDTFTFDTPSVLKECTYTRVNYKFIGWCENKNYNPDLHTLLQPNESKAYNLSKTTNPVTLYAIWELQPNLSVLNIPVSRAGYSNTLQCELKGDLLTGKAQKISLSCEADPSVIASASITEKDDKTISIAIPIPKKAGIYQIIAHFDDGTPSGQSVTQQMKVFTFGANTIGYIVLNDGTVYKPDTFDISNKGKVVGIIATGESDPYGVPYVIEKKTTHTNCSWADSTSPVYNHDFAELKHPTDKKGVDNKAVVDALYPKDSSVFDCCSKGWFIPTCTEWQIMYQNSPAINKGLQAVGESALDTTVSYWSSNQGDTPTTAKSIKLEQALDSDGLPYFPITDTDKATSANIDVRLIGTGRYL